MIILSFDIGIKNLAYCQLDTVSKDILDWFILDCSCKNNDDTMLEVINQLESVPNLLESDIILLEKQPSFNPKMRIISTALYVYFTLRISYENQKNIKILFYSAKNKLKVCNSSECVKILENKNMKAKTAKDKRMNYSCNKKAAIEQTRHDLINSGFLSYFDKSKKKDDLADSYLQAIAYLN